jgi:hypothetical protein
LSGRLDVEGYLPQEDPPWLIPSTDPFVAPRLRLFGDAFFGDRVVSSAELRMDRGEEPRAGALDLRIDQLFVRVIPLDALALQAGKFVSPFGGWPQRHHTAADPFIRPPLAYDHRTILSAAKAPVSAVDFLAWKDSPESWRAQGAPVIWGAPYQWGAMLMGGFAMFDWRAAVVNSAPSSEPEEWGLARGFRSPSWVANAGAQLSPALRVELSFNTGPWLREDADGLPSNMQASDYHQRIWGLETVFKYGRTKLRGEAFHDAWGVPNVGYDVIDLSWYVEAEQSVATAVTLAARVGGLHFLEMRGAVDTADPNYDARYAARWDYDIRRLQIAAGYRLARNAGLRAEVMLNDAVGPVRARNNLLAAQFWWEF